MTSINMYILVLLVIYYADDCSANNVDTLQECTNNSIACIKQWYDMNTLVINTAKSNVMVVSSKQRHSPAARGGNLAKIPPNQVIDDFGRGSSVES